ncbi:hypothetical protein COLO4_22129 [Corchorus olitorius]|uniref:Uncharacterized protein n=1 Tax=Corchorus olitorius TaxID=93759 RepID=A0A1R3INZ6_9ROSI|nr:hypothetical protein COLO4_22129 [Corchorus olitorius]
MARFFLVLVLLLQLMLLHSAEEKDVNGHRSDCPMSSIVGNMMRLLFLKDHAECGMLNCGEKVEKDNHLSSLNFMYMTLIGGVENWINAICRDGEAEDIDPEMIRGLMEMLDQHNEIAKCDRNW